MKRSKKLVLLLIILVVMWCGILIVQRLNPETEEAEGDSTITVIAQDYTDTTEFSWTYGDRETLTFTKTENGWQYAKDEAFPLKTSYVDTMFYSVCSLTASRVLEDPQQLSDYGLEDPLCTIVINGEEGITLEIGNETSIGGERYASIGDGKVYLVNESLLSSFDYELYDLVDKEEIPTMSNVSAMKVQQGDMNWEVKVEEETELIDTVTGLYWGTCMTYTAEAADLGDYGLDDPIVVTIDYVITTTIDTGETDEEGSTVYETEETTYTFVVEIGCTEEGMAYGRLPESGMIYQVNTTIADALQAYINAQ